MSPKTKRPVGVIYVWRRYIACRDADGTIRVGCETYPDDDAALAAARDTQEGRRFAAAVRADEALSVAQLLADCTPGQRAWAAH